MKAPRDASHDDYMGEALKDPAEAAAYIEAVLELDEPATLLVALRQVAKVHGTQHGGKRVWNSMSCRWQRKLGGANDCLGACATWMAQSKSSPCLMLPADERHVLVAVV